MLVPVCSGMSKKEHVAHHREMAERLNGMGYLVVHVDYVTTRRLTDACGSFVPPDDIAKDIIAVAKHLRSLPLVNPARIDVIGESLGGGGVLAALSQPGPDDLPGFRRAVVFYPVCRGVSPPRARAEVLMLFGGLDSMTPAESCQQIVRQFTKPTDVQFRVYPDARHGFNLAHLPQTPPTGQPSWTPAYHPAAAKAAWEDAANFLRR
jgi:dienelactone hydrolase